MRAGPGAVHSVPSTPSQAPGSSPVLAPPLPVPWGPAQAQAPGPEGGLGHPVGKGPLGHPSSPVWVVVVVLLRPN